MNGFFHKSLTQPEGKTLEFKRDLSSPKRLIKTLVAFANTAGGHLVIGVEDDRTVVGVDNPLDEEERICNMIADAIAPHLVPNVELVTVDGKTLVLVEVFLSGTRPHYVKAEGPEAGVYVRLGSTNRKADRELVAELRRSSEGIAFDELPMPDLSIDDLDLKAAQGLFGPTTPLDEKALITLKLLTRHQGRLVPTKGAVLLFCTQRTFHFADAWIQCGRFTGTQKIDIFDHHEIHGSLPESVEQVMLFLKKHAYRGADLSEIRRKDVWSIPLGILREAVINALVHTDYSQRGAPIRIVFLDDRIEIENPGIFLPGLTLEDIKQGTSKIRNNVIARVFRELHFIEQWGTGVRRIFEEAKTLGLPEPQLMEVGMRVRLVVPLAEMHVARKGQAVSPDSTPPTQLPTQSPTQSDDPVIRLLSLLAHEPLSSGELRERLSLKHRPSFRDNYLHPALKVGFIEMTLPDKPSSRLQKYSLTDKGRERLATHEKDSGKWGVGSG